MSCFNKMILVLVLMAIAATSLRGQVKKGQVGFRFLENQISAEAIGRGGMGIITFKNSNAVFWNPAGLGFIKGKIDFNMNYTKGIADINHSSFVVALPFENIGVVALDLLVMDYGEFYGTRRADNEQGYVETGTFSPGSYAIGLSISRKVSERFSFGVRLKYARQDLGSAWIAVAGTDLDDPALKIEQKSYNLGQFAFDVGAVYDFLFRSIRFGAAIQNVSKEIKYEEEKFPLPFAAGFSFMMDPIALIKQEEQQNSLIIGFETRHPRDFNERYMIGAEYNYQNLFILRSGYMGNYDERGFTFGLGVRQEFLNTNLRIDYSYKDFGIFSAEHTFSFGCTY